MPSFAKSRLTYRVTTHAQGVDDPPEGDARHGADERAGGELLIVVCGRRVEGIESPDPKLGTMAVEMLGWDGRVTCSHGQARPLNHHEALQLLVGGAANLAQHFSDDRRALLLAFVDAFYEIVQTDLGLASPPSIDDLNKRRGGSGPH